MDVIQFEAYLSVNMFVLFLVMVFQCPVKFAVEEILLYLVFVSSFMIKLIV